MGSSPAVSTRAAATVRPWHRLAVRLAAVFVAVTLFTVGVVGVLVHHRQSREIEDTVGTQLLNIARVSGLLVDPALHAEAAARRRADALGNRRITEILHTIQTETLLTTPMRTLTDFDRATRRARIVVTTADGERPGASFIVGPEAADAVAWTFEDGVARYTGIYRTPAGPRISAFAPIPGEGGRTAAVLEVDYPVDFYFDRLRELDGTIMQGMAAGALLAVALAVIVARRLTRPVIALTGAAARVAGGDLTATLPVWSRDEVGQLTGAFNTMVDGLRQREIIRNAFGRYVSPEVAQAVLESPEGLRLGGRKREVTVLMSDLRGYTRFAEHGDPSGVMAVLNEYLGRMADIVIAHGGTVNEFIGDAIFAVFGAPVEHADHAERAAACALAMQRAMDKINEINVAQGRPRFEMGIGVNTGEAVVGNIGSEQRTKYAVVGAAVNLAARVESCTVGGQVLLTTSTLRYLGALADVAPPVHAELKGLDAPVALYELHGVAGRWAQRRETAAEAGVDVELPLIGWVVEGKTVRADPFTGTVRSLGRRYLDVATKTVLSPLTNVRLRLTWAESGRASGDMYGKVTGEMGGLVRIHLTSVDPGDDVLLMAARAGTEAP
jgi:class 3 adenylate cyclase